MLHAFPRDCRKVIPGADRYYRRAGWSVFIRTLEFSRGFAVSCSADQTLQRQDDKLAFSSQGDVVNGLPTLLKRALDARIWVRIRF